MRRTRRAGMMKEACHAAMKSQTECGKDVKLGYLWSRVGEVGHGSGGNLKDSWKLFHTIRRFTWRPDLMIGNDWRPSCTTCHSKGKVKVNMSTVAPRLVYGRHENYILNAPIQYRCTRCCSRSKGQKRANVSRRERVQWTFCSTHTQVLEELSASHPHVHAAFPCYLSCRRGIDKDFMTSIIESAVRGLVQVRPPR